MPNLSVHLALPFIHSFTPEPNSVYSGYFHKCKGAQNDSVSERGDRDHRIEIGQNRGTTTTTTTKNPSKNQQ